ncbi:MAG: hypothetical protein WCD18_03665 [Thermosynechococcaceae cyanobacterium]
MEPTQTSPTLVVEGQAAAHPAHPTAWKWYDYFTFNTDHKNLFEKSLIPL